MGIELRIFTAVPGRRWGGGGGGGARPLIEAQRCNWAAENVLLVRDGGEDQVSDRPSFNFATHRDKQVNVEP